MNEMQDPILDIAKKHFDIPYLFPYQRLVISNILRAARIPPYDPGDEFEDELTPRQIVLLPTGAGKSLCFMIPAFLTEGISLVIFPLLSLLSDQLRRTEEAGLPSAVLRGGQDEIERDEIFSQCRRGKIRMILTNPETLLNPDILSRMESINIGHVVIDETHTVSEWGDTFRPAYLELHSVLETLKPDLVTAFTATASEHILKRIKEVLFPHDSPNIVFGNPDRPNISYSVIKSYNPSYTLFRLVMKARNPLIIFTPSRSEAELTARMLRRLMRRDCIYFYHAGLDKEEKDRVEKWFFDSDDGILVATCAYGMGVDKKNIRTVIHTAPPSTVESYLQESGRAGRDRLPSSALLIYSSSARLRLKAMKNSLARDRYGRMIEYAERTDVCRRETLLAMLDSQCEICSGCDICGDSLEEEDYAGQIKQILKYHRRRFTQKEFTLFLKGYKTKKIREKLLHEVRGFGSFSRWDPSMIEEMINNMITVGVIRIPERGFGKHRITF